MSQNGISPQFGGEIPNMFETILDKVLKPS